MGLFWGTHIQHGGKFVPKTVPRYTLTTISSRSPTQPQSGEFRVRSLVLLVFTKAKNHEHLKYSRIGEFQDCWLCRSQVITKIRRTNRPENNKFIAVVACGLVFSQAGLARFILPCNNIPEIFQCRFTRGALRSRSQGNRHPRTIKSIASPFDVVLFRLKFSKTVDF